MMAMLRICSMNVGESSLSSFLMMSFEEFSAGDEIRVKVAEMVSEKKGADYARPPGCRQPAACHLVRETI